MAATYLTPGEGGSFEDQDEYVTREVVKDGGVFSTALRNLVLMETARKSYESVPATMLTTHECWSGYSEYTVTGQWQEVTVTVPEWNWEKRFEAMPAFFAALGEAEAWSAGSGW